MSHPIDPRLAVDLTETGSVDLSKAATAARQNQRKLIKAADWARSMQRAFKGIRGAPNRRQRADIALAKFGVQDQ